MISLLTFLVRFRQDASHSCLQASTACAPVKSTHSATHVTTSSGYWNLSTFSATTENRSCFSFLIFLCHSYLSLHESMTPNFLCHQNASFGSVKTRLHLDVVQQLACLHDPTILGRGLNHAWKVNW